MSINFQRLLDVCKATELLPLGRFAMQAINSCGTAGCMIGNYNAMTGRYLGTFSHAIGEMQLFDDWDYFGLTEEEYHWLFAEGAWIESTLDDKSRRLDTDWRELRDVTRDQALARLRKFIYYKLHKHELCYDEKYGVSDRARRAEGNQNFAGRAVAKAAELAGATA